ncbi:neural cell adhesion molecule L1-like [Panulirus ornatus]|uniref:neural cell adhesion molecule L1-like n=1 Tax=Panulirus ornatus TaxID=150431 RepID=UPI003A85EA10
MVRRIIRRWAGDIITVVLITGLISGHGDHDAGYGIKRASLYVVRPLLQDSHLCFCSSWSRRNDHPLGAHSDDLGVVEGMDEVVDVDPASWSDYLNTLFDPVFDPSVTSNVSAVEGQTAHLVCRVNNLGTKTVSWIRHRDTHILTVGSFTYTSDHRFSALHREGTNEWTLQIRHPTVSDTGLYECQVSTKPIRAYLISLAVVVPKARILHAPELYTNAGGALNLTCVVSPSPAPPEYIFWYHRGQVINYESEGSVEVSVRQEEGRTVSTLLVARATLAHSGHYQCAPSNTDRAEITVHVFKAEEPAAMQTSSGTVVVQQAAAFVLSAAVRCTPPTSPLVLRTAGDLRAAATLPLLSAVTRCRSSRCCIPPASAEDLYGVDHVGAAAVSFFPDGALQLHTFCCF